MKSGLTAPELLLSLSSGWAARIWFMCPGVSISGTIVTWYFCPSATRSAMSCLE